MLTGDKTFLLNGPGNYKEECKVFWGYSGKHAAQQTHNKSRASGNDERGRTVLFKPRAKDMNSILNNAVSSVLKNKGGWGVPKNVTVILKLKHQTMVSALVVLTS